jgi:fumarate reductase flavoprotein subunit
VSPAGKTKTENLTANIVVIGSGGGLVGALAAAEKGIKDIIVLEKQGVIGGDTRLARGFFAVDSPIQQREAIIDATSDAAFKILMKWNHWGGINPRLIRAWLNKTGDTVNWLQKKGLDFEIKPIYPSQKLRSWHWPRAKGEKETQYWSSNVLMETLTKECEKLGVKMLLHTSARGIIRSSKGNITGVVAVNKEGQEFKITTKAVIISTGGMSGSKELMKKYNPDYVDDGKPITGRQAFFTGDGLLMAEKVGAAIAVSVPKNYEPNVAGANRPKDYLPGVVREPYLILINKKGRRFADESDNWVGEPANAIIMQPDRVCWYVFDDAMIQRMEKRGVLIGRGWGEAEVAQREGMPGLHEEFQRHARENIVKISNSWDEIAGWIGAEPEAMKAEIKEYNSYCDHGYDAIFDKNPQYLIPLRTPPYYAIKCTAGIGQIYGGIKVNERLEVLDSQFDKIPGLYASGDCVDGFIGQSGYSFELGGTHMSFAINSGRIAGESAAEYVLGK